MNAIARGTIILTAWLGLGSLGAIGQVVERDTTITGPKGNSIERQVRTERGPGFVERDIKIQRPGGATFQRDTRVVGPRAMGALPGPRVVPRSGFYGGRPAFVERDVIVR